MLSKAATGMQRIQGADKKIMQVLHQPESDVGYYNNRRPYSSCHSAAITFLQCEHVKPFPDDRLDGHNIRMPAFSKINRSSTCRTRPGVSSFASAAPRLA